MEALFRSAIQDSDNQELFRILTSHGLVLDLDHTNHVGLTPLHQAVLNNNLDGVKMLLHCDVKVNLPDVNGYTPLHTASACGFLQIASLLMVFGACVFSATQDGDLAVDLATDTPTSRLLQQQMIVQFHQRTYWRSWILYKCHELVTYLLKCVIFLVGTAAQVFEQQWEIYRQKKNRTVAAETVADTKLVKSE